MLLAPALIAVLLDRRPGQPVARAVFLAGTAFDVVESDAASNRGSDEIRALRDAVKFAPATLTRIAFEGSRARLIDLNHTPDARQMAAGRGPVRE